MNLYQIFMTIQINVLIQLMKLLLENIKKSLKKKNQLIKSIQRKKKIYQNMRIFLKQRIKNIILQQK